MEEVEAVKHLTEEQLVSHYYGELDNPLEAVKHLEFCEACRARFAALDSDLSLMKAATIPDRPDDYGRRIWHGLQPRLEDKPVWSGSRWFVFPQWKLAAVAVLLLVAGFVAGRFGPGRQAPFPGPVSEAARSRILMATVADHLDQSQRALLELATNPMPAPRTLLPIRHGQRNSLRPTGSTASLPHRLVRPAWRQSWTN